VWDLGDFSAEEKEGISGSDTTFEPVHARSMKECRVLGGRRDAERDEFR
jgi:hypothetical protein